MNIPDKYIKETGWVRPIDLDALVNRVAFVATHDGRIRNARTYFVDCVISPAEEKNNQSVLAALQEIKIQNAKMSLEEKADSFSNPKFYNPETEEWEKI